MGRANQLRLRYEQSTHSAKADAHNLIKGSRPLCPSPAVQEIVAAGGEPDIDA